MVVALRIASKVKAVECWGYFWGRRGARYGVRDQGPRGAEAEPCVLATHCREPYAERARPRSKRGVQPRPGSKAELVRRRRACLVLLGEHGVAIRDGRRVSRCEDRRCCRKGGNPIRRALAKRIKLEGIFEVLPLGASEETQALRVIV